MTILDLRHKGELHSHINGLADVVHNNIPFASESDLRKSSPFTQGDECGNNGKPKLLKIDDEKVRVATLFVVFRPVINKREHVGQKTIVKQMKGTKTLAVIPKEDGRPERKDPMGFDIVRLWPTVSAHRVECVKITGSDNLNFDWAIAPVADFQPEFSFYCENNFDSLCGRKVNV
ncbi:hypothetical protein RUM44_009868 [Polyplax serrata]|uniref:Uncharacterized protein n=1 Tax=Polyplax serrata TaxID=468196 RepID=A0ABR1ATY1_POLSC